MDIIITRLCEKHLCPLMAIEKRAFVSPWSRILFIQELKSPYSESFVAVLNDGQRQNSIIGYICTRVIVDECSIFKLATHHHYRNMGVASSLLCHVINRAKDKLIKTISLEVRSSNIAAISLYRKFGFVPAGVRRGYYTDTGDDAIIMILHMDTKIMRQVDFYKPCNFYIVKG